MRSAWLVPLVPLALSLGCGDGGELVGGGTPIPEQEVTARLAEAICEVEFGCGCSTYETVQECVSSTRGQLELAIGPAAEPNGIYQTLAASRIIGIIDELGCRDASQVGIERWVELWNQLSTIDLYGGGAGEGESCLPASIDFAIVGPEWFGDTCAPGLQCLGGMCLDWAETPVVAVDDGSCEGVCPNGDGPGQYPTQSRVCTDGHLPTQGCPAAPAIGEPCVELAEPWISDLPGSEGMCDVGAYCDPDTNTCAALPGEGETCAAALIWGTFVPKWAEDICAEGLRCRSEAKCEPITDEDLEGPNCPLGYRPDSRQDGRCVPGGRPLACLIY